MPKKKDYILFLNSHYSKRDNDFYLKQIGNRTRVAVDGGIRFFRKNKIIPDILIGDFDSTPRLSKKYLSQFEVLSHPSRKDKTDSQLALETILERGAEDILICGAIAKTEIDHTLSNVFILDLINRFKKRFKKSVTARLVGPGFEIYLLDNESIDVRGWRGDYISILPLRDGVWIDYAGLDYPVPKRALRFGDTLSLRNRFKKVSGRVTVRGKAIVVILSKERRG